MTRAITEKFRRPMKTERLDGQSQIEIGISQPIPRAQPALVVDHVGLCYERQAEPPLEVIDDVTFSIRPNEFVTIVGRSGCGKSSLTLAMVGLIELQRGAILVNGEDYRTRRSGSIALVYQNPQLLPWLTVLGNIMFALSPKKLSKAEKREIAEAEIERVGLSNFAKSYPSQLSGGMQQRVNIARALAVDASILVLDEPLASLDAFTRDSMQQELLNIWSSRKKAVLCITHQVDEALFLSDRVIVLSERPATVKAIVDVPFPRPRTLALKRTAAFMEMENTIWSHLGLGAEGSTYDF